MKLLHDSFLNLPIIDGEILVISGASGSGKGSVIAELLKRTPNVFFNISITSRTPRPGEENGREYYFDSRENILHMNNIAQLLEYVEYGGNLYGTLTRPIVEATKAGKLVIIDMELQGVSKLKALDIWKKPPCFLFLQCEEQERRKRLISRNTENPEQIEKRIALGNDEESKAIDLYDDSDLIQSVIVSSSHYKEIAIDFTVRQIISRLEEFREVHW